MSQRYLIMTNIEGRLRLLSLLCSGSPSPSLVREMLGLLFPARRVGRVWMTPWPLKEGGKAGARQPAG